MADSRWTFVVRRLTQPIYQCQSPNPKHSDNRDRQVRYATVINSEAERKEGTACCQDAAYLWIVADGRLEKFIVKV